MGRTRVCWDNAVAELLFATWKTEFYYRRVRPTEAGASFELHHCNQPAAALQAA